MQIQFKPATQADVPFILACIRELAEFEKLLHEVVATEAILTESLFGPNAHAEVILAYCDDTAVGFALFFHNFSTFLGKSGIYLEDLYIKPQYRSHGIGRMFLQHIAALTKSRDCGRFEWSVLDWNKHAIRFYESLGAEAMAGWSTYRVTGKALENLAENPKVSEKAMNT